MKTILLNLFIICDETRDLSRLGIKYDLQQIVEGGRISDEMKQSMMVSWIDRVSGYG